VDNNDKSYTKLNAVTGLAFYFFGKIDWAEYFVKEIISRQKTDGYIQYEPEDNKEEYEDHISQSVYLFYHLYQSTKKKKYLDCARSSCDWVISKGDKSNYWNMMVANLFDKTEWCRIAAEENQDNLDVLAHYGKVLGNYWARNVKKMCYERMDRQVPPSNIWKAGSFCDSEGKTRIDWSERYIRTFKKILSIISSES